MIDAHRYAEATARSDDRDRLVAAFASLNRHVVVADQFGQRANARLTVPCGPGSPGVAEALAQVVDEIPPDQQPLTRMFIAARTADLVALANSTDDPNSLLHALRYLPDVSIAKERLRAAVILAKRLDALNDHRRLELLTHAVNLVPAPACEGAVVGLAPDDRTILAAAVNALFTSNDFQERYLAICAMRTVGDERSLDLLRGNPADVSEGTRQRAINGLIVVEPISASVRRQADEAIRARALTH